MAYLKSSYKRDCCNVSTVTWHREYFLNPILKVNEIVNKTFNNNVVNNYTIGYSKGMCDKCSKITFPTDKSKTYISCNGCAIALCEHSLFTFQGQYYCFVCAPMGSVK